MFQSHRLELTRADICGTPTPMFRLPTAATLQCARQVAPLGMSGARALYMQRPLSAQSTTSTAKRRAMSASASPAPPTLPQGYLVDVEIAPDRIDDFLQALKIDAEGSRNEPGCLRFDVIRHAEATDFSCQPHAAAHPSPSAHRPSGTCEVAETATPIDMSLCAYTTI